MTVIDLTEQIDEICSRYPEYWHSDEAVRELQALWGGADCNDCGVFERDETIRIELDGQKSGTEKSGSPSRRTAGTPSPQATGTARAAADQRLPSGTASPTPRATKPSPPASTNSSPNSRASATERLRAAKPVRARAAHDRNPQSLPVAVPPVVAFLKIAQPVRCPQQRGSSAPNTAPRFLLSFPWLVVTLRLSLPGLPPSSTGARAE